MGAREIIEKYGQNSLKNLEKKRVFSVSRGFNFEVKETAAEIHGDYASGAAMVLAKKLKKNPLEVANFIESEIKSQGSGIFEKIEVVNPGFINFFLSKEYLQKQTEDILKEKNNFGKLDIGKGKKVQVEFISANPTGSLHIGNGRGAFFGDVLSNVLEKSGYKVEREYFINNAKSGIQIKELGKTVLGKGAAYSNDHLKDLIENNKSQIDKFNSDGEAGSFLANIIQKENQDFIENILKIKFDKWFSEEELYKDNKIKKILGWLKKESLVYEKDKALWLKTSQFGDDKDWVVVKESGEPTYLLVDIAYHKDKFDRGFQKIIDIWGADHQGHVNKIKAVAKILKYKGDLNILVSQIVRLKGGLKLSKRKGEIITLKDLINEVGLDIARFLYLTKSLNTQMEFDLELAKEQSEKNPVYYIQYAHARICSILKKAEEMKLNSKKPNLKLLIHSSELKLIKQLIKLPEIIEDISKDYQVQRLPKYVLDLATVFHQFYRDCIVVSENLNLSLARLSLVKATKTVLVNSLNLMGISAPEKM